LQWGGDVLSLRRKFEMSSSKQYLQLHAYKYEKDEENLENLETISSSFLPFCGHLHREICNVVVMISHIEPSYMLFFAVNLQAKVSEA